MNLINHSVVVVNPDNDNYGRIGFCKSCRRGTYTVLFKDGVGFYQEDDIELVGEKNISPKSLLKSGDLVIDECGNKYRAFLEYEDDFYKEILVDTKKGEFLSLDYYDDDLIFRYSYGQYNIEAIYSPKTPSSYLTDDLMKYKLKWSRKKTKKMTIEEIKDALGLTERGIELIILKGEKKSE